MKKTNMAKKGLMPAVLGAVCSVVALTSVSYAWFTMGSESKVEDIEVNVQAAGGMQISADAVNWKSVLPLEDLQKVTSNKFDISEDGMKPTSSVGQFAAGEQEMFFGEIDENGVLKANAADAEGNYISFDLYIKVDKTEKLVLDATSYVKGTNSSIHTEYATRVSFTDLGSTEGTPDNAKDLNLNYAGIATKIWEPNANKHAQEILSNGTLVNDPETSEDETVSPHKNEGISSVNESGIPSKGEVKNLFTTNYSADSTIGQQVELLELEKGINKVRVTIWLEGEDIDCVNSISGAGFIVGLNFNLLKPVEPTGE